MTMSVDQSSLRQLLVATEKNMKTLEWSNRTKNRTSLETVCYFMWNVIVWSSILGLHVVRQMDFGKK
jgi:hypothetical protein